MPHGDVECRNCGLLNPSQAEACGECGRPLHTIFAPLLSSEEIAATTPDQMFGDTAPADKTPHPAAARAAPIDGESEVEDEDVAERAAESLSWSAIIGPETHKLVGTTVGEYEVTSMIAAGGMGTVFSGVQPVIGKQVAIKVLKPALSDDADVMERFLAEAKAVNTIRHPNIVDIFSFGQLVDGSQYFVMELLSGRNLAAHLRQHRTVGYDDALTIMKQVLGALEAAHQRGIVHRDLKPDNIFLADHPSGGFIVKLLDFGIAKFIEDGVTVGRTRTGVPIGTPMYMSPEQCRGKDVDHRSDIYSLGLILYEMFTGRRPYAASTVYQLVNAHIRQDPDKPSSQVAFPEALEEIILQCLAKAKRDRPASVTALKDVLIPELERLAGTDEKAPKPMPTLPPIVLREGGMESTPQRASGAQPDPGSSGSFRRAGLLILGGAVIVSGAVLASDWLGWLRSPPRPRAKTRTPTRTTVPQPDASPAVRRTDPSVVWLRFRISPRDVPKTVTVDGKRVTGKLIAVKRSRERPVRIRIVAAGYGVYEDDWMPESDDTFTLRLTPKGASPMAPNTMRPITSPRRRPPPMDGTRPATMRPAWMMRPDRYMGIDML